MSRPTDANAVFNGYRQIAISDARASIREIVDALVRDGERVVLSRQGEPIAFIAPLGDLYELDDVDAADSSAADNALAEHARELARPQTVKVHDRRLTSERAAVHIRKGPRPKPNSIKVMKKPLAPVKMVGKAAPKAGPGRAKSKKASPKRKSML
jgi:antitoxin (DNA-binding transcriptional repressor) of toxin-antitoxin stability system